MRFAYQRGGAPLLSWKHGVPRQSRASDTVALGGLGSLGDHTLALELPRAGAPEPLPALSGCGPCAMGCSDAPGSKCPCPKPGMGSTDMSAPIKIAIGIGAIFLALKVIGRKK